MSNQIQPILVSDPLLQLDDKINYAVFRGGQNVSTQKFPATSQTSTSHIYAVQIPSTTTVVDRNFIWGSDITFEITGTVLADKFLVEYPSNTVLAPFPLNQLCTNMSVQINNTTLSLPVNQVLDPLLRSVDKDSIARWQGATPTQLDYYGYYPQEAGDGNDFVASAFNGYDRAVSRQEPPRGAFPVSITGNTVGATGALNKVVYLTVSVREPVFISPFIFGEPEGHSGLTGITQINITAQMDATAKRAVRWFADALKFSAKAITNVSYSNSFIECKFLTPKASDLIPQTVITPLATFTNYILPAPASVLANGAATQLTSNSIMLNSIPDKVFVFVRNAQANITNLDADVYCRIDGVSVTVGAQSGLLSNFLPIDLYRASYNAGSQQTYLDYNGSALGENSVDNEDGLNIVTVGSVLCLDFGQTINIPEDYYAPGSLSTTQFQINVNFTNTTGKSINPELNVMFMNSGVFSTTNGASSAYTSGVLSKQVVLDAQSMQPVSKHELNRLVGGGLFSSLKSIASKALPVLGSVAKGVLSNVQHPLAQMGSQALGALGYGRRGGADLVAPAPVAEGGRRRGGAMTAGAMTAGADPVEGGRRLKNRVM